MLQLNNITKEYMAGDDKVEALRGISIEFRDNEFVSIYFETYHLFQGNFFDNNLKQQKILIHPHYKFDQVLHLIL